MIRSKCAAAAGGVILVLLAIGTAACAEVSVSDFAEAFESIPVSDLGRFIAAAELGLSQADFPASQTLQLIGRLAATAHSPQEKEALLLNIVIAMEDGLPVDGLVTKGLEGLARAVSVPLIEQSLHQRLILIAETRDLLYAKGIFSVEPGSPQSVPTALPTPRFNLLVSHISDTLADYLEGGGSPFEGETLCQEVRFRLTSLEGATLVAADVDLVLKRVEPADLTRVALSAVT